MKQSITSRFIGIISAVLIGSAIVISTVIAVSERNMLTHSLMAKGESFASYIAKLSKDPIIMKDFIKLDDIVNDANRDEEVVYVLVTDSKGTVLTSQFASIDYQWPPTKDVISTLPKDIEVPEIVAAIKKEEPILEVSVPVTVDIDVIGKVIIGLSKHKILLQIKRTAVFVVTLNVVVSIMLGIIFVAVSKKLILNPVTELSKAATRLAKGDRKTQVTVKSQGEIQALVDNFNQMARDLEKTTVSKEFVDNIIRSMINSLVVVSRDGTIARSNGATCALLGYAEDELIGRPFEMIFDKETAWSGISLDSLKMQEKTNNLEVAYLAKNGTRIPMIFSSSALHDPSGGYQGVVCVAQDLTERKRAEDALAEQAEKLARSNTELEQFAYVASHDLQEPLRKIQAFGDRLFGKFGETLGEQGNDYLARMKNAAERMQILINDLLAFSRVTTKAQPFVPVDLAHLVQEVLSDLETRIERTNARVEIGELPVIEADSLQMRQLMQNLIGNALKFHGASETPVVRVRCEPADGGGQCRIIVSDNGIGFDEKYLDRIFAPFQRLHGRSEYEGSGIGLAICRKISERHGGSITARSAPGDGAEFIVTLPLRQTDS